MLSPKMFHPEKTNGHIVFFWSLVHCDMWVASFQKDQLQRNETSSERIHRSENEHFGLRKYGGLNIHRLHQCSHVTTRRALDSVRTSAPTSGDWADSLKSKLAGRSGYLIFTRCMNRAKPCKSEETNPDIWKLGTCHKNELLHKRPPDTWTFCPVPGKQEA